MTLEVEVPGTSWGPLIFGWVCSRNLKAATGGSCCVKKNCSLVCFCLGIWGVSILIETAISEHKCKIIRYSVRDLPVFLEDTEVFFKVHHGHKKWKDDSLLVSYDYDDTCLHSGKITAFFFILSKSTERYWHCPGKLRFSVCWIVGIQFEYIGKCICSKFTRSPK